MRLFAATVLALCACNQVYGLDPTTVEPPPDAPDRQVRLSMLVGGSTVNASEAPPMVVDVTPDPMPRVALVDGALKKVDYGAGGVVGYPNDFLAKQWRLEYTPPAGVPVEVQWSPADGMGHIVVPVVGRVERTQVPTGTGYAVTSKKADQTLYTFSDGVVYTTGYWSATPSASVTTTMNVDFSVAPSMSGPAGAPSMAAGDVVVAIDYTVDGTGCRVPIRVASALATPLQPGAMTSLELAVDGSSEGAVFAYKGDTTQEAQQRLVEALGARADDPSGSRATFGRLAHAGLPAFTTTNAGVPAPAIIPLATCPITVQMPPFVSVAGALLSFTKGLYAVVTNERLVAGVRLRSSIAAIGLLSDGSTYEATFNVPLATSVLLGNDDLTSSMRSDGGLIDAAPADLTFQIQQDTSTVVDYYEVALYRLTSNSLELVRTYVGTNPNEAKLRFDPSVMMPNAEHVFAIRTYRGRPNARVADFSTVQGPQTVGTIFTRTFRR